MAEFIVAGAGHGGLCAALHLAKGGRRVTVLERLPEAGLGYDWTDVVDTGALARNGFSALPESSKAVAYKGTLLGPDKRFPLRPSGAISKEVHIERKEWLALMIRDCRAAGVEFRFGTDILGPAVEGNRVCGLRVRTAGGEELCPAGMVIDAAGAQSPVRTNLPARLGVPGTLPQDQLFYGWRGFFNRLPGPDPRDFYKQYLCHQGRKGLSWVIANPGCMDVLVGNMGGPLDEAAVAGAIADLRRDNPLLGEQLLRGGGAQPSIPVRRPLGLSVAEGYAAVGDSACMADPFSGCGICAAMDQGKLLAEILMACNGDYTLPKLWEYQYRTFTGKPPAEHGDAAKTAAQRAATDVMRCVMMSLRPEEIDLMFGRGLIALRNGLRKPKDALLLLRGLDHPRMLWRLAKIPVRGKKIREITRGIPGTYGPAAVAAWVKAYEGCKMR